MLFDYSIAENIRYGEPKANDSEVYDAAKNANALEFIQRMNQEGEEVKNGGTFPEKKLSDSHVGTLDRGFYVECGLRGGKLSGG